MLNLHLIKNNEIQLNNKLYGYLIYYLLFIILIPIIILYTQGFQNIRFYLTIIDLIANVLASIFPLFSNIYMPTPIDILSYISTNFINLLALIGVSWIGIKSAFKNKSIQMGIQITIIMYVITYLIPTQTIPLIIQTIDKLYKGDKFEYDKELILGMFLIFIFVIIESLLIYYIVDKN